MTSLKAEIARLKGSSKPSEVKELVLDKCKASELKGDECEGFSNLEVLSMNNVGLTTLSNFPQLHKLKRLELNDNKISGGLDALQEATLINLEVLNLSGNRLRLLADLEPLGCLPKLKQLDLFKCEVANSESYRDKVFEMIPSLRVLDGCDRNGDEAEIDDEEDEDGEEEEEDGEDGDIDGEEGEEEEDLDDGEEDFGEDDADGGLEEGAGEEDEEDGFGEEDGEEEEEEEEGEGEGEGEEAEGDGEEDDEEGDEDEGEEDPAAGAKRPRLG